MSVFSRLNYDDANDLEELDYYQIRQILCNDDVEALRAIPDVGTRKMENLEKYSILHYAVEYESEQCIEYLVQTYPELLYSRTQSGEIPLYIGLVCGIDIIDHYPDIKKIIEEGGDINGSTPIHMAVKYNGEEQLKKLLRISSKSINKPDIYGRIPLYLAIENSAEWEIIEVLLEYGADPFYKIPVPKNGYIYADLEGETISPYELAKRESSNQYYGDEDEYIKYVLHKFIEWVETTCAYDIKEPES